MVVYDEKDLIRHIEEGGRHTRHHYKLNSAVMIDDIELGSGLVFEECIFEYVGDAGSIPYATHIIPSYDYTNHGSPRAFVPMAEGSPVEEVVYTANTLF